MLEVKIDPGLLKDLKGPDVAKAIKGSAARTINRAMRSARAVGSKELAKHLRAKKMSVKQSQLKNLIGMQTAKASNLEGSLWVRPKIIPAIQFQPREELVQTSRGWRLGVSVKYSGKRIFLPGAFVARMRRTGYVGIFRRVTARRLPIKQVYAPYSALEIAADSGVVDKMRQHGRTRIVMESEREIAYVARAIAMRRARSFVGPLLPDSAST